VLIAGAAVPAALFVATGGLDHGEGRPRGVFAASMSVWIVAAVVALWAAVGRGRAPMGRATPWLVGVAAGTPSLILLAMGALSAALPTRDALLLGSVHRLAASCMSMTFAAALLPLLAMLFVRRGSDPVHPATHGAALGAAFGAFAGVMVCLWCPDVSLRHIALGHVAPLVLTSLAGAAAGARLLPMAPPRRGST